MTIETKKYPALCETNQQQEEVEKQMDLTIQQLVMRGEFEELELLRKNLWNRKKNKQLSPSKILKRIKSCERRGVDFKQWLINADWDYKMINRSLRKVDKHLFQSHTDKVTV